MSDTLSKIRDKTAQQKPKYQDPLLSQLRAIAEGYWNRQGQIAREGSTLADIGRQQLQSGNPMGLVNLPLGAAAWLGSPAGALVPTSDEVYATDLPEWSKPGVAGVLMGMSAMTPGPDIPKAGRAAKAASAADEGITAYHGSPHTFDKFDMSKIGTGEGAQAYGHGLYFAEAENVAKKYRDDLTAMRTNAAQIELDRAGGNIDDAIAQTRARIDNLKALPNGGGDPARQARQIAIQEEKLAEFNALKNNSRSVDETGKIINPGSMYQVRLNVKPDELLDWDRPLSEQSDAVAEALGALQTQFYPVKRGKKWDVLDSSGEFVVGGFKTKREAYAGSLGDFGHEAYKRLGLTSPQSTAKLKSLGIKGIRYKDQGSRDKDGGTYNYVIFDDKLIDILKRYAIPFTLGAGGAAMVSGGDMPPEIAAQMGPEA